MWLRVRIDRLRQNARGINVRGAIGRLVNAERAVAVVEIGEFARRREQSCRGGRSKIRRREIRPAPIGRALSKCQQWRKIDRAAVTSAITSPEDGTTRSVGLESLRGQNRWLIGRRYESRQPARRERVGQFRRCEIGSSEPKASAPVPNTMAASRLATTPETRRRRASSARQPRPPPRHSASAADRRRTARRSPRRGWSSATDEKQRHRRQYFRTVQ